MRFKHLPNLLRLGAFVVFVSCATAVWSLRAASAHVREGMLSLGREMMQYADGSSMGRTRTLQINGASLDFASGSTRDGLSTVLDFYRDRCATRDGISRQLSDMEGTLPPTGPAATPSARPLSTFRVDDGARGYVACFDVGQRQLSPNELVRRLQAFVASGDLSELGHLRYLYAERLGSGRTRFVGFWSDGEVNVVHMFPTTGDAPGEDPENIPRPNGMRRMLSAREIEHPYSMSIFSGTDGSDVVESHFRTEMPHHGWHLIPPRGPDAEAHTRHMLTFERGNATATIVVTSGHGNQTAVTVLTAH